MTHLPGYAHDLLTSCPKAGTGVHNWLFRTARVLHRFMPQERIALELRDKVQTCGRIVTEREIKDAVINSLKFAGRAQKASGRLSFNYKGQKPESKWPARDSELVKELSASGFGLNDLHDLSHLKHKSKRTATDSVIEILFPDNPWICVGASSRRFDTRRRQEWSGMLSDLQFIVPNPMSKKYGLTLNKKPSTHCLDNTGDRSYLVIEFDEGTQNEHAAIIYALAQIAPLCLVVLSGGKSLHGWFDVKNSSTKLQLEFMRHAVSLGADPATWTRCQFVRMPDGMRDNGKRQSVIYFNPENVQ